MYHLYHGPSELGKSMAVAHALSGRDGVVHLVLREKTEQVLSILATALGSTGKFAQTCGNFI